MNQTEHYGLSQWALTDRVEMKDFNADNAKLDAALAALSGLQTSESARLDAAIAAETTRVNKELAKKALASDLSGLETSLSDKLEYVKLMDTSFTVANNTCSISVPGSTMGQCVLVHMYITTSSLPSGALVHVNTTKDGYHTSSGSSSGSAGLMVINKSYTSRAVLFPMRRGTEPVYGIGFVNSIFYSLYSTASYNSLTSLVLAPSSGTTTLSGSGHLYIYGLQ